MAATPQYGTLLFRADSGKTISVDFYVSDVANALVRFDGGAGSGSASPDYWVAPERGVIADMSIITGTADTTKMRLVMNGVPLSTVIRYSLHVSTNPFRPSINIGMNAGTRLTAFQIA